MQRYDIQDNRKTSLAIHVINAGSRLTVYGVGKVKGKGIAVEVAIPADGNSLSSTRYLLRRHLKSSAAGQLSLYLILYNDTYSFYLGFVYAKSHILHGASTIFCTAPRPNKLVSGIYLTS